MEAKLSTKPDIEISALVEKFLGDCSARNLSKNTVTFYQERLAIFKSFCSQEQIDEIEQLNPDRLRKFILGLEKNHNPGGVHAIYRALRALTFFYIREYDREDDFKNPFRKVKIKATKLNPLDPIPLDDVERMAKTCEKGTFLGDRDRASFFSSGYRRTSARVFGFGNQGC